MSIIISKEEKESRMETHIIKILIEYFVEMKIFKISD